MKQQYDSYKPSGIDWIGDIPSHWDLRRMRYLCDIITGDKDTVNRVDDGLYPFYVRSPQIERINSYSFDGEAVLMAGDGVGAGKVLHYATGKFDFHQRVYNFHNFRDIKGKLLYQYLKSLFKYKIEEGGAKNTVDSVRQPWLKDFPVCIPPLAEQEAITAWLDEKCEEIDAAIAKVDREIELIDELKQSEISRVVTRGLNPDALLRPSGIDWIGDIPSHWKINKLKYHAEIFSGEALSTKNLTEYSEIPVYGGGNILGYSKVANTKCNTLITGRVGGDGTVRLIRKNFWATDNALIIETDLEKTFLCNILNCANLIRLNTSTAQPLLTATKIKNVEIPVPPLPEQQAIVDYLDKKCAEMDGLKAKLTKKLETLKELRQSIISEVVTGKRKII